MNIRIKVHSNGQNNHKTILLKVKELDIKECFHYDHTDEESIMVRAKMLKEKKLGYIFDNTPLDKENENLKNKGMVGNFIQKNWFGIPPNNSPEPDFEEAGIELKCCPIIQKKTKGKETDQRTKISSINYFELVDETWLNSHAKKKLNKVLFVFHERIDDLKKWKKTEVLDVALWVLSDQDKFNLIEKDWLKANNAVKHGLAHILSESYFSILKTSRAGSGGVNKYGIHKDLVKQPVTTFSTYAMKRAFSIDKNYTTQFWNEIRQPKSFESIKDSLNISKTESYRDAFIKSFNPFIGKTIGEISEMSNIPVPTAKSATATIVGIMVGFKRLNSKIKEFSQLGITIKTVPIRTEDKTLFEAISFPSFVIKEFIQEDWEDSTFLNYLNKIIFVPFSRKNRTEALENRVLEKPFFWSPTPSQLELIRTEWELYKKELSQKIIIEKIPSKNTKGYREKIINLSKEKDTNAIHIRPHGKDSNDRDEYNYETSVIKQSFWLNKKFVKKLVLDSLND